MQTPAPHFRTRGYYVILSRIQEWGLDDWKRYIDCMVEDGCNFLILWIAGGFPSDLFPATWTYNRDHRNVRENFAGAVIDYAKTNGIETVLGFTPYAYDGVASYVQAHPELAGLREDGSVHAQRGIHDVGMWMCPSKPESREFMLDYVRELYFDFYPNADGLFIESSDYGHCMCPECREGYTQREWEFVRDISSEVWARKPDARMVIYPLYYQRGVASPDPRFTLFFTPHSAHITPDVKAIDCEKLYWVMLFGMEPDAAREGALVAADEGMDGYVVAMEAFSYREDVDGRMLEYHPFDVPWSKPGTFPFADLVPSVPRFTYACYSREPRMSREQYTAAVADRFFGSAERTGEAEDLVYLATVLQRGFQHFGRRSSLVHPEDFERQYPPEKRSAAREECMAVLARFGQISRRYSGSDGAAGELGRIAGWIVDRWQVWPPGADEPNRM